MTFNESEPALNEAELDHFINKGHVVIKNCFKKEDVQDWIDLAFKRLEYDKNDSSTWKEEKVHLGVMNSKFLKEYSPRAVSAMQQLVGGKERMNFPDPKLFDGFIINFSLDAKKGWQPPSPEYDGWHKDGENFKHFLDSPEQGLLTIMIFSDIKSKGGGTFIACDSVKHVAELLFQHPEGLYLDSFHAKDLIGKCSDFKECTGELGDIILLHPYILHCASPNVSGKARFIINPPITLKRPMNFNRENVSDHSPVEQAILHVLGKKRCEFKPAAPREYFMSDHAKKRKSELEKQKKMLQGK